MFVDKNKSNIDAILARIDGWNEQDHPRNPEGSSKGGQFTSSGGSSGKFTPEEQHLSNYVSKEPGSELHSHQINAGLRRESGLTGEQKEAVKGIDAIFASAPPTTKPMVLYRGMPTSVLGDKPNTVGWEKGYSSTSTDFENARAYTQESKVGVVYEIHVPVGSKVIDTGKYDLAHGGEEDEVLLPRGSRFVIDKRYKKDGVKVVSVRMVDGMRGRVDNAICRAAGVMFVAPDGAVLMLRRSANASDHLGEWAFPGGGVEGDETVEDAARREAIEEVGTHYYGDLEPWTRRVRDGVDFTLFRQHVPERFDPVLNEEHDAFQWVDTRADSEFVESEHPRDKDGKFSEILVTEEGQKFYHGTSEENMHSILKQGITPEGSGRQSGLPGVHETGVHAHVTFDPGTANRYANSATAIGKEPVVFQVEFPVGTRLNEDMTATAAYKYKGVIKPEWITNRAIGGIWQKRFTR
jgi:8-oxo-dGTP pyrophosphatase MutT (NUDIX family)